MSVFHLTEAETELFKLKALTWASAFAHAAYFDSNGFSDPYSDFDMMLAAGAIRVLDASSDPFSALEQFLDHNGYIPGYFSYDLKNELENLKSENLDSLSFPEMHFFIPEHTLLLQGNRLQIISDDPKTVFTAISQTVLNTKVTGSAIQLKTRLSKAEYEYTVGQLLSHIQRGDIYEINFCQEFFAENTVIDPLTVFLKLRSISPTPFSSFLKLENRFILSASPERFLSRRGDKLISQPIKGTAARNEDAELDRQQRENFRKDEKQRTENVMIVDLVRNDLTRSAAPGTVRVEELFGVYSFPQVHQMISTIVCERNPELSNVGIIANTFPMGSMTGAPKIMAMTLTEQFERSKRGVYSGALGYFAPNGDFDFNVVIRTLLYNAENKYLSFHTGGAITLDSDASMEYEECLLKAKAILKALDGSL